MSRTNDLTGSWAEEKRHLTDEVDQKAHHINIISTRNRKLQAENDWLRQLLQKHGVEVPDIGTPVKPDQNGSAGPARTENPGSAANGTSNTKPEPEPVHVTAAKIVTEQAATPAVANVSKDVPAASTASQPSAEAEAEDEADMAPKEAAAAIIGAFHSANQTAAASSSAFPSTSTTATAIASNIPSSSTTATAVTSNVPSSSSTTAVTSNVPSSSAIPSTPAPAESGDGRLDSTSTQSSTAPEIGDSAKIHVQLLYATGKDSLAITVMKAADLSTLGILDFSKIVFKSDLVPGRLVSSKSPAVVYSNGLPLNVTMNLAVRQTSFKWKKLQLSLCSVSEGTSETCLGKTQVSLMEFYNNPDPDIVEMWLTIGGDSDDSVFTDKPDKSSITGAGLLGRDPSARAALGTTRRHTLGGAEMQSSIAKAKALTPGAMAAMDASRRSSLTTTPATVTTAAAALATERGSQHRSMSAAVMQAARDEARRKASSGSSSSSSSSNGGEDRTGGATSSSFAGTSTAAVPARANVDGGVPDVRALNRSRAGNTSIPRTAVSASSLPSSSTAAATTNMPAQRTLSGSERPAAPASQPVVPAAPARPNLAALGKAASVDSLPTERHDSRGSGNSDELRKAIAQNRAAKEVLAALDKDKPEEKADSGEKDIEPEEEESQFVRRASFRLKELRNSQRNKPERLSFRQKQAFFVTANVAIPGAEKKK